MSRTVNLAACVMCEYHVGVTTLEAPAPTSLPTVEAPPSILGGHAAPPRRVRFQDQQMEPTPPAPCSQSETVFPGTPAGVFACSDWSSTKGPARQQCWPSHLDLYTEVWGEPCGEEHSAAEVQQQHQVAPCHLRAVSITSAAPLCLLLPGGGGEWWLSTTAPPAYSSVRPVV